MTAPTAESERLARVERKLDRIENAVRAIALRTIFPMRNAFDDLRSGDKERMRRAIEDERRFIYDRLEQIMSEGLEP